MSNAFGLSPQSYAHVVFSAIAAPTDIEASKLIECLGVQEALEFVCSSREVKDLASVMKETQDITKLSISMQRWRENLLRNDFNDQARLLETKQGFICTPNMPSWPVSLNDLGYSAPFALWGIGKSDFINQKQQTVALVGSRTASAYGQQIALEFGQYLAQKDILVISGGAYGVDISAHVGVLQADGITIAVMAGGVDELYPRANEQYFNQILENGAIISEVPCGRRPSRIRFLERNRLIAAMSEVIVVVEAGYRSGAISTVNHGLELGREIAAVPGMVSTDYSAGCHRLIREGATLVRSGADLLELLGYEEKIVETQPSIFDAMSSNGARVYDALPAKGWASIGTIGRNSGLGEQEIVSELGILELSGKVLRREKYFRRAS